MTPSLLPQEGRTGRMVRTVDGRMTRHTTSAEQPVARLGDVVVVDRRRMLGVRVTALTEERQLGHEHPVVRRTVRIVAGRTAVAGDARVLEQIRAALFGVARRAG